jgi:hypothetical protein
MVQSTLIFSCPIEMLFSSTQQNISEKEFLSFMSNTVKIVLENKRTFLIFYYLNLLNQKISCKEKKEKMIKEFFEKERIFEINEVIEENEDEYYSQNCNFQASQIYQKCLTFSNQEEMEILIEITTGIQECVKEKKTTIPKKKKKEETEEKKLKGIIKRVSRLDDYNPNEGQEYDEEEEEEEFFEEEEEDEEEKESESQDDEKEQPKRKRGRPKKIKEEKPRKIVRKKNVTPISSVPSPQITKDIESKLKTYFFIQENCVEWKEERIGAKKKILGNYLGKSKKETSNTPTTPTIESISLSSQIPSSTVTSVNTTIPQVDSTVYKIPKKKTTTPTTPIDKIVSPPLQQQPIISTPMPPDISTPYPKDSLFQWCKHHSYPFPQFKEIKNTSEGVVVGVILPHLNNLLFSDAVFSPNLEISENRACMKAIEYMWSLKQPNKQEFVQNDPRRFPPQMESNNSDPWRQQNRMNYDPQQKYFQRYDDKNFRY